MNRYLERMVSVGNGNYIYYWQSKEFSDEKINSIKTLNHSITPNLDYYGTEIRVEFNGSCLIQDGVAFNHRKVMNMFIVYEISKCFNISDYPTLENCLFGAVNLTKNADIDKCKYFGYRIGFDRHRSFSFPDTGLGRNVIIFGVDMSSSIKIVYRKKYFLILSKGPTQGLEHTLSARKMYSINFTEDNKKLCLNLYYNGANSYMFVNGKEMQKFKAKDSEIVALPLCLRNISKGWSVDNMKKTGLNGYIYDFSIDYDATAADYILEIHKCLMRRNDTFGFIKRHFFYRIIIFINFNERKFVERSSAELYFNEQSRL